MSAALVDDVLLKRLEDAVPRVVGVILRGEPGCENSINASAYEAAKLRSGNAVPHAREGEARVGEVAVVTAPDVGGGELDGAREDPRQEGVEVIGDGWQRPTCEASRSGPSTGSLSCVLAGRRRHDATTSGSTTET